MTSSTFRAGVGRVAITPPLVAPHAGWGAQTHVLPDGVDTDLWATVLVVADGDAMASFVDLDLVIVSRQESDAIRAAVAGVLGIGPSAVRVSVTHNHAGPPPSSWDWAGEGQSVLRQYYDLLATQVAVAARRAGLSLRPARVAVGSGHSSVAVNRRETAPCGRTVTGVNLGGPIDPQVFVVRIDGVEGSPLAVVVGYTMHPTTMGPTNRLISPDWPGYLKRTVEAMTGATCLFAQGATGDIGPGPKGFTADRRVIQCLGTRVGCEAVRVFLDIDLPPVRYLHDRIQESGAALGLWKTQPIAEPSVRVRTASQFIELPVGAQIPIDQANAAVTEAQERLHLLRVDGAPLAEIEAATFVAKRANMTSYRAHTFAGHRSFPVELQLLQIGPAVLAGVECEPFSASGLAIKEQSPFPHTWFGGYTGGWFGYVPTPDEFLRQGYEVETSPYTPDAAGELVSQTITALERFASQS